MTAKKIPDVVELSEAELIEVQAGSGPDFSWNKSWSTSGDADDVPTDPTPNRKI